ncbi:FecR family protein [Taibaiella soli]|uniref:FecR protein domain-containing protein n=1 Tax=Taibaiella soli TaxID=1649169 RepID=A0A2W2AVK7_9BACT|nr:FecR domain-containing protein [Taibaiella soli]PZF71994.1 hypothetical protein DN068_15275 [Taibaiella soli]
MNEQIQIIIAKQLSNEASAAELQLLQNWLAENPDHSKELDSVKTAWQAAGQVIEKLPVCDASAAWAKISSRICPDKLQDKKPTRVISLTKWAVGAAAVLLIGFFVFRLASPADVKVLASTQNQMIVLPDGTHVTLKKGSTLTYPKEFAASERHVALSGEAFFEVTHNEHQPFTIGAKKADVRVLGTKFNVCCNDQRTEVTVASGRVQVTNHDNSEEKVVLTKGEHAIVAAGPIAKDAVADDNYLYWKTGNLEFRQTPFDEVVASIAKVTDTQIRLDASLSATQKSQAINISFHEQSVEEMLTEICLITQCKWAKQNNMYIITAK